MKLIVGTGSTWSLRVWICLQLVDVKTSEVVIDLGSDDYQAKILEHSPTGLVPVLIDGNIVTHDSLAIIEHINESCLGSLYPDGVKDRALARSLCAEMHSGFMNLRQQFPFSVNACAKSAVLNDDIQKELDRVETIFGSATLPYMFEFAGAVDAFYAILAYRLNSYGITLKGKAGEYQQSLLDWQLLNDAIAQAKHWESVK
ncbi:glutathione S-transferase N-terminal domain-containing protein [Psychromonas sp.]|nr:glutathione S-transferase N-terminal domain-containing protein [Psychromonas sp.]